MLRKFTAIAILTTLLIGAAAAVPAEMSIFPAESSTEINSFTSYEVTVENPGSTQDVYQLSSDARQVTIAPREVDLDAGERKTVNVWYNPDERMEAGAHDFRVTATSRASGDRSSVTGTANVIKDHEVSITTTELRTACLGEQVKYDVQVTNDGIQEEEFQIKADYGELSRNRVTLEPEETTTVTVTASSNSPTQENFNIVATSVTSYAQDQMNVDFSAERCFASEVEVTPESQNVAAHTEAEYEVTVRNTGTKADEFVLSTSLGEIDTDQVNIDSGNAVSATVSYTPTELGSEQLTVTADSTTESSETVELNTYNGMDLSTSFTEDQVNTCEDKETKEVLLNVENTGEAEELYTVSTSMGELEREELELTPGQSDVVAVNVNASELEEEETYNINAEVESTTFGEPVDTAATELYVENCWDVELNVVPEVASAGENRSTVFEIQVRNPGARENTYTLSREGPKWTEIKPEEITVDAGQTETSYLYAGAPFEKEGEVRITVDAEGNQASESQKVTLAVNKEIEEAILSEEGGNGITGAFRGAVSGIGDAITETGNAAKVAVSVVVGAALTGLVLFLG